MQEFGQTWPNMSEYVVSIPYSERRNQVARNNLPSSLNNLELMLYDSGYCLDRVFPA